MFFMGKHARSLWRGAKIGYWKPYNHQHQGKKSFTEIRRGLTTRTYNYGQGPDDEPDIFLYAIGGTIALYAIERYRRKP